ncbi:glutamate-rich protein 6 [Carcharodon carcharias]|uniref:glutamate-rich protein 6 n=1 Tax=Carcharodon carcharias TaxID=13397 RepID=UPI001B7EBBFF|nr:glutamate-rich protein 6 [Carcharodon carcharias]
MSEENVSQPESHVTQDQESPAQVDLESSVSSGTSRFENQTGSTTDEEEYTRASETILDSASTTSLSLYETPPTSVLTQTDSSWLLSQSLRKSDKETESIVEDDISDSTSKGSLDDLIAHSEFIDEESEKLFRPALYTLPSVGLPTILAYKHESKEKPINYKAVMPEVKSDWLQNPRELHDVKEYWQWMSNKLIQKELSHLSSENQFSQSNKSLIQKELSYLSSENQFSQSNKSLDKTPHLSKSISEHQWEQFRESVVSIGFDLCQFCGKNLKPLPTPKKLSTEAPETLFCCKQYQDLFEFLMREEALMKLKAGLELIDISPHLPFGSVLEREQAKEKAAMRLRDREMETFLRKAKERHRASPGPRRLTTITFHLSTSLDFVTLKEERRRVEERDNIFTESGDDTFSWHKDIPSSFMVKYYRNGNKFLTAFPDGMAQIFYPSGNLAILIFIDKQKKISCIVQEDRASEPAIRAVFSSNGRCTCYHPNGVVWININALGGHYLDQQGTRVKRWCWRERLSPLIFAPFKPIFISLNENIGVRIIEQGRIFITFLAMGQQAKFKVGRKLKPKRVSKEFLTNSWITEDELLLQASQLKVRTAINKLCITLNFPSNNPEKIPLPLYLVSQQQRLARLYANIKVEESVEVEKAA